MSVIQILMDEHRVIEQVLSCLERMADDCEQEKRLDTTSANEAIAFFRTFADRCHHGKEERLLFPALESCGFSPYRGPTAVMRSEHVLGRKLIGGISDAVDGADTSEEAAVSNFIKYARAYVELLRAHIQKEDHCLFPMARQKLDAVAIEDLSRGFTRVEREEVGESAHDEYLQLANRLADRYDVPRAEVAACQEGSSGVRRS